MTDVARLAERPDVVDEHVYLTAFLKPVEKWLRHERVAEIFVNRPGEFWVEVAGGAMQRVSSPDITDQHIQRLAAQIARFNRQAINREHPVLAASLPGGERVQIVGPPATRRHWAMAIRRPVVSHLSLSDFSGGDDFGKVALADERRLSARDAALLKLLRARRIPEFLDFAVKAKKTILISGGTSTGKTSLLNSLLKSVPAHERLITVEDTAEMTLEHENSVGLIAVKGDLGEARIGVDDLLNASLRLRPDRIILGELRGREAVTFLRAINTGHPGSITTIHADSPHGAFEQIALMALQAGMPLTRLETIDYVRSIIDIAVHVVREGGARRIAEIMFTPQGGENSAQS
ncbi:MAG: P-type DNA transfer ATPase VirB11 [Parvularculaceae bacterium]|nr:P-type DNA transfer ATPase VirB11 [Parvularculaceae bacterium]